MAKSDSPTGELTTLLHAWRGGDRQAKERVWTIVYDELRQLAHHMRYGRGRAAAGMTTVVHEAYLRLLGGADVDWRERGHFYAVAARAMRFVLVDQARRRLAKKRAAELTGEIPEKIVDPSTHAPEDVLAIHQALDRLAKINPRQEKLVELHYFSGLTLDESAEILGVSRRTSMRDWKAVRIWLHGELKMAGGSAAGA